ncbi:superinfection exclusion B family protein [Paraferrimonas sp. SM1919]|uniref:superinfection exclusion B family protein n=1 Tax=Paraferrimonas sp. SM1919 TaxID=2662263 RepID=UPI0013D142E1|nr:superinfection exclusion B family protein [Paraferrimonas sp. SM1919]
MPKNVKSYFDSLVMWLLLCSSLLIFLPQPVLQLIGVANWLGQYDIYIGLVFIGCSGLKLINVFNYGLDHAIRSLKQQRQKQDIDEKIEFLDQAERSLLREFFIQSSSILTMPTTEISVINLKQAGVLEQLGKERHYAISEPTAEFRISLYARKKLNRQLLMLPKGQPDEVEMKRLLKTRPEFHKNIIKPNKTAA